MIAIMLVCKLQHTAVFSPPFLQKNVSRFSQIQLLPIFNFLYFNQTDLRSVTQLPLMILLLHQPLFDIIIDKIICVFTI